MYNSLLGAEQVLTAGVTKAGLREDTHFLDHMSTRKLMFYHGYKNKHHTHLYNWANINPSVLKITFFKIL